MVEIRLKKVHSYLNARFHLKHYLLRFVFTLYYAQISFLFYSKNLLLPRENLKPSKSSNLTLFPDCVLVNTFPLKNQADLWICSLLISLLMSSKLRPVTSSPNLYLALFISYPFLIILYWFIPFTVFKIHGFMSWFAKNFLLH